MLKKLFAKRPSGRLNSDCEKIELVY
jgi:hypothetical protein